MYIADSREQKILESIPAWYRKISKAGSFLLFPLVVEQRPLGLIYSDHPNPRGMATGCYGDVPDQRVVSPRSNPSEKM